MNTQVLNGGPAPAAAWKQLHAAASAPYRAHGRFAWHFARGKLGHDPVFRGMLERGDLAGRARVLDIGSGQSLLASLLHQCNLLQRAGGWPADWPVTTATQYTGIELMQRDVDRAERSLAGLPLAARFVCGDMRTAAFPPCDLVVILDVLHYVDHAEQQAVLQRVKAALSPRGRLLLRVGDVAQRGGFAASQWTDRLITWVRGHRVPPTFGRPVRDWQALLESLGFKVHAVPMSQGTPFANVLLVADLGGAP